MQKSNYFGYIQLTLLISSYSRSTHCERKEKYWNKIQPKTKVILEKKGRRFSYFHSTLFLSMSTSYIGITGNFKRFLNANVFQFSLLLFNLESKIKFLFHITKTPTLTLFAKEIHLKCKFMVIKAMTLYCY